LEVLVANADLPVAAAFWTDHELLTSAHAAVGEPLAVVGTEVVAGAIHEHALETREYRSPF
jgi:hypothetical protein